MTKEAAELARCLVDERRARAERGVGHPRPRQAQRHPRSTASRSTAWRTSPTASCAARWRASSARRRIPIAVIKWKEIYETLETATDRCEDVANIIEGVVLENS